MRKLIAAINMTLDGLCDHAEMIAEIIALLLVTWTSIRKDGKKTFKTV